MNETNVGFDLNEEEIIIFAAEVSDDAVERAACSRPENAAVLTIAMCTGQSECPF